MTKLLDCPECGDKDCPVRNDALVCSTKCRVAKHRRLEKEARHRRAKLKESESERL